MKTLLRLLAIRDLRTTAITRTLHGLRSGDQRELYTGLGLAALAYLSQTKPRRQLLYRKSVPEGSAIVIHHRRRGDPKIEVVKPPRT